ncbi:MAG TPA: alpha/beta hydrolase [Dermatophilaceae bacterium]|nr:alpha/beta hydrolase [Dermatophilaceae bacterium]
MSSEAVAGPRPQGAQAAGTEHDGAGRHTAPPSRWVDLGVPVHYVDHGGPPNGPLLVMVHGLGGSLVNWAALAPLLTGTCRVLALDLIGFGHTQAGAHSASVTANQVMLNQFLATVAGGPAVLVGNSMGGVISILQARRHPGSVTALALIDPALPVTVSSQPDALVSASFGMYAVPRLGHAVLRARRRARTPEQLAMDVLRLCCVDPGRVPADVREQHLKLARARREYPDIDRHFLVAARSLLRMLTRRSAFMATMKGIQVPVLLLHGEKDRLVSIGASRAVAAANPTWRFEVAPDVGHVPQLEVPDWTAGRILDWLATDAGEAVSSTKRRHQQEE